MSDETELEVIEEEIAVTIEENADEINLQGDTLVVTGTGGKIEKAFDCTDAGELGIIEIGTLPPGAMVESCVIDVLSEFNDDVTMTVGDNTAHASLMTVFDNQPEAIGACKTSPYRDYPEGGQINLYFPTIEPTQGSAKVIVTYS